MKNLFKLSMLMLLSVGFTACNDDDDVNALNGPVVSFPNTGDFMRVDVDQEILFVANVENGERLSCSWTLDGEVISTEATATYTFLTPGNYQVYFSATDGKEIVGEKTYYVEALGIPLVVSYSNEAEEIKVKLDQGERLDVSVTVLSGDKQTRHEWKLDGEVISTTANCVKELTAEGTHTLVYKGVNSDNMEATRTWTVVAANTPLEMTFSLDDTKTVYNRVTEAVAITATLVDGGPIASQSWKVDGVDAGITGLEFSKTFDACGDHTIAFSASNEAGKTVEKSWTIYTVVETFEGLDAIPSFFSGFQGSKKGLADNPCVNDANPSAKVLINGGFTWSTSGSFTMTCTDAMKPVLAKSSYIRMMVYVGDLEDCCPTLRLYLNDASKGDKQPMMINGVAFNSKDADAADKWKANIKVNDWNEIVYSSSKWAAVAGELGTLEGVTKFDFRSVTNVTGGNLPTIGADKAVYFDNIEFIGSL